MLVGEGDVTLIVSEDERLGNWLWLVVMKEFVNSSQGRYSVSFSIALFS